MNKGIKLLVAIQLILLTAVFGKNDSTMNINETKLELTSDLFQNVVAKGGEENVKISWSLNHDAYAQLKAEGKQLVITYNTKIGKKRSKSGYEGGEWMFTEPFSVDEMSYKLKSLVGNESYYFKLGVAKEGTIEHSMTDKSKMIWSEEAKTKTKRGWGIAKLLILIGSLAFFIYGMKLMSEGLQQAAGGKLRSMLSSITSNRFKGVLTGFGITSIVQSSSVTTVMTVSFVNAGLMSLRQSAGVMMGANIGTTITGWLILLLGFKVSIGSYAYMIIALAAPLLFIQKGKSKAWASAIFGFCILFIGLGELKDAVPSLGAVSSIVQFFIDFKDVWYGPVMFVILGALVTVVIQSSSAAMALTLAMVSTGTIPFEVACAMILGENIGTTITAELASMIANVHAKRSARIHSMFNIVGVVWALLIFHWMIRGLSYFVEGDPYAMTPEGIAVAGTTIVLFHTVFNAANVLLLIGFVPQLVSLAEKTVKSKGEADEEFKLDFIGGPLGSTAELCILEAKKEVAKFGKTTSRMNGFVNTYVNSSEKKEKYKMLTKLEKYEEITDRVEVEIADYLGQTARLEMSDEASIQMRSMMNISTDLERIGDIFYQISKVLEKKDSEKSYFTPEQRDGVNSMIAITEEAFEIMNDNLDSQYGTISMEKAIAKEKAINSLRDNLRKKHLKNINSEEFKMSGSLVYINVVASFEKVGDHIINVSEAVAGEI